MSYYAEPILASVTPKIGPYQEYKRGIERYGSWFVLLFKGVNIFRSGSPPGRLWRVPRPRPARRDAALAGALVAAERAAAGKPFGAARQTRPAAIDKAVKLIRRRFCPAPIVSIVVLQSNCWEVETIQDNWCGDSSLS